MDSALLQNAITGGSGSPWDLLLKVGAERLRETSSSKPPATGPSELVFFPPDEREAFSVDDADFLLRARSPEFGIGTGKRFPASRVDKLVEMLAGKYSQRVLSDEEIGRLCGNAGRFLVFISKNEYLKRNFPPQFQYETLDRETQIRETTRVALDSPSTRLRLNALMTLRELDPAKGRELLAEICQKAESDDPKKAPKLRADLLLSMWYGLSEEDEPFLEDALATGNAATVRTAVKLLVQLPSSRVGKVLRELADSVLTSDGKLVPPAYSKDLKKFGIPKCEGAELAARIIGSVPLSHWENRFAATPEKIAKIFPAAQETEPVYAGWMISVVSFGAGPEWVRVVASICQLSRAGTKRPIFVEESLSKLLNDETGERQDDYDNLFKKVASTIAPEAARDCESTYLKYLCEIFGDTADHSDYRQFEATADYEPTPWSDEFCERYFKFVFDDLTIEKAYLRAFMLMTQVHMFPRIWRDKILTILQDLGKEPGVYRIALDDASRNIQKANEAEDRFGDYRKALKPLGISYKYQDALPWIRINERKEALAKRAQ